jgi:opacity protein-like surface antigen
MMPSTKPVSFAKNTFVRRMPLVVAGLLLSVSAGAQSYGERDHSWELGLDGVYQNTATLNFKGGSTAKLATDFGLSVYAAYNFSEHIQLQGALDWSNVDYKAYIVTDAGATANANGTYQAFTPRLNLQYNFIEGPVTPFAIGGIGYGYIDTNIPNGRPVSGCYWDPWYGYLCGTAQSTKTVDGFTYLAGAGVRWDVTDYGSVRLAYERHWVDFGSQGSPYVDQVKLGFSWRPAY